MPEDPQLVAAILRLAWDISASEQVQYLAMCALGYRFPLTERGPRDFHRIAPSVLRSFLPVGSATLDEVITAGVRIRELMQNYGLRSTHVPREVRFAIDARIVDTVQYRWRLYVCLQLRHWLHCLDLNDQSDRNSGEYAEKASEPLFGQIRCWRGPSTPSNVTDAATFLSQMLGLAEDLAAGSPAWPTDTVHQISLSTLHQLSPAAATAVRVTRGVRVARYCMKESSAHRVRAVRQHAHQPHTADG